MDGAMPNPTPSQVTMLIAWERELEHQPGDEKAAAAPGEGEAASAGSDNLKLRDWVTYTVSMALLALQEEGSISMEYVERKKLWVFPSRHVVLTKLGPTSFPAASFEAELWSKLGESPTTTSKLVRHWFGGSAEDPWRKVMARIQSNLLEAGLLTKDVEDTHRGRIAGALLGKTKTKFHADAQARELLAQVDSMHARLTQPDETEDPLRARVFNEVSRAILSKKTVEAGD